MVKNCYWICGTAQEGLSAGGYMLHYIQSLFVFFLRQRIHASSKLHHLLIFMTLIDSQCYFYPYHAPYSKPAVNANIYIFILFIFVSQFVKLKDSLRIMCLERDVYFLYVAQCLNSVYHPRQLLLHRDALEKNQKLFKFHSMSSLLKFLTYRLRDEAVELHSQHLNLFQQMDIDIATELVNTLCSALHP